MATRDVSADRFRAKVSDALQRGRDGSDRSRLEILETLTAELESELERDSDQENQA